MKLKRNKNYENQLFLGVFFFSKNKCGNFIQKYIYAFNCLFNSKIKNAKQDLQQLTKCCDNCLFLKTNGTEILKTKDLLEKLLFND